MAEEEAKLFLELGQVIKMEAPTDPTLHENIYLIDYLDNNLIKLINNDDLRKTNNKVLWRKDLASPMSEMLSTLVLVIIIRYGGKTVLNNEIDADSFIGFLVILIFLSLFSLFLIFSQIFQEHQLNLFD